MLHKEIKAKGRSGGDDDDSNGYDVEGGGDGGDDDHDDDDDDDDGDDCDNDDEIIGGDFWEESPIRRLHSVHRGYEQTAHQFNNEMIWADLAQPVPRAPHHFCPAKLWSVVFEVGEINH